MTLTDHHQADRRNAVVRLLASGNVHKPPDVVRANGKFNSLAQFVQQIRRAGPCMTVVKTSTGAAQSVAVAIDKAQWPEVVGTLSGDDTIFIATGNARAQTCIVSRLREMFGV